MGNNYETIGVTWGRVLKVWWWIAWRSSVVGVIAGFILGFFIGMILGIAKVEPPIIEKIASILGTVFGLFINFIFLKKVIGKEFKGFRLEMIKEENLIND